MGRLFTALLALVTACSSEIVAAATTTISPTSTSTTSPVTTSTSTTTPTATGHLIKLDPLTLEPMPGFDPISIVADIWAMSSPDGSLVVTFQWDEAAKSSHARTIDVGRWEQIATFEAGPIAGAAIQDDVLYTSDHQSGELVSIDLRTGRESVLADWSPNHWLYEGPIVLPGGRIALLAAEPVGPEEEATFSVLIFDAATQAKIQHPVGNLERVNRATGVFDGEREIPERDAPGVVWGDDRLFLTYMDGPEVIEVNLDTGAIVSHLIELSAWWDRVWAFWTPAASAKGPSLGTYSSAALSSDGRYLFMSGNKQKVTTAADGTLAEESEHLGLVVVDTEGWRAIAGPALPIQYVRKAGDAIVGVDTTSFTPWTEDLYILSIDPSDKPTAGGPLSVTDGMCEQATDERYLICTEYGSSAHIQLIEIETLDTVAGRAMGLEDTLLPNGVLVDSIPRSEP